MVNVQSLTSTSSNLSSISAKCSYMTTWLSPRLGHAESIINNFRLDKYDTVCKCPFQDPKVFA